MKGIWNNPVMGFLADLKLAAVLLAGLALASGWATFVENDFGRDGAYAVVYAAWWFELLMGLLILNMTLVFIRDWPYPIHRIGYILVHLSIVVILVGAGITRYLGYEGIMSIREGRSVDYTFSAKPHIQAGLGEETASFATRLYKHGNPGLHKSVTLQGQTYELGVDQYWPHFAEVYEEGQDGVPAMEYGESGPQGVSNHLIVVGGRTTIGQVDTRFLSGDFTGEMSQSPFGELRVRAGGEICSQSVASVENQPFTCGGLTFTITEFQTDFKVGGAANASGPLVNPMIRVAITDTDGQQGERLLFAFHPDFSMGHSGGEDAFAALDMLYQVQQGFELVSGGETGIRGRAAFALTTMDMDTREQGDIPAGEIFEVREHILYVNDASSFSFVPVRLMESAVKVPGLSDNPQDPAAARVVLRDQAGNQAAAVCIKHARGTEVDLGGQTFTLSYGPVVRQLPYSLYLEDFVMNTYPGSDNPATYESHVVLTDPEQGIENQKAHIFMNSPLNHRGSKHFQSSYDPDRKGTVLTVNHDPGKWPTYVGYTLLTLGFILILLKEVIWPRKKRSKSARTMAAAVVAGLLVFGGGVRAQDGNQDGHEGHNHAPGEGHDQPTGFVTFSDPAREAASLLIIQDYRGRMKPLDTLAREMVMKVAKRSKFEGRHPVDQYLSWSINPTFWWDKPLIAVRHAGLKDLLGVDQSVKHVSAVSLFDGRGQYRLTQLVEEAHRTPDRERTKVQRKLLSFDERFNLLYMTFRGSTLRLYPVPGDQNNTWLNHEDVQSHLDAAQTTAYGAAFANLADGVRSGDNARIMQGIQQTAQLQQQYGAEVLPPQGRVSAELLYNRSHLFSWMMIPLLVACVILMPVYIWNLFRNKAARLKFTNIFYSLGLILYCGAFAGMLFAYVLRWVASGRAPLSNGHESLLFISLAVMLAGLIFELVYRMSAPAGLSSLLTVVILGVSMLSMFDPAIGPLVPVLVSYWLNIHVTVITASYGFLGLAALVGALILILLLAKGKGRENLREALWTLDRVNFHLMITGLGLLSVGTLLGGVWANESWGRYWGWDAKETWSLVTILVYAFVLHLRYIPQMRSLWLNSSLAMLAIASVVMTYFGVNYFLSGLHSYAQGDAAQVPNWVFIFTGVGLALIVVTGLVSRVKRWEAEA